MEKNSFSQSHLWKTSTDIGKIIPCFLKYLVPGDTFSITPKFSVTMAPFEDQVSGVFQVKWKFVKVNLRNIWSNFDRFYMNEAGFTGTCPYKAYDSNAVITPEELEYYLPAKLAPAPAGTSYTVSALPYRAYVMAHAEHWIKNLNIVQPEASRQNLWLKTDGQDNNAYGIKYDEYDADLFTRLKQDPQYGTAPSLNAPFSYAQLQNLIEETKWREKVNATVMDTYNQIAAIFGVTPSIDNRSKLVAEYAIELSLQDLIQTATTSEAPIGAGASIGFTRPNFDSFTVEAGGEFCIVIGMMSIVPDSCIMTGASPEMLPFTTSIEMYKHEYANAGMTPVMFKEIDLVNSATANPVMGYRPIFSEFRSTSNVITGELSRSFSGKTTHRYPALAYASPYTLSHCQQTEYDYLFADADEPQAVVTAQYGVKSLRPIPKTSFEPIGE